jgi:hypothetical protein
MFQDSEPDDIENWVCVMEGGTEYEVEIAKNYLTEQNIPSNILSKRDSSFSVNYGEMGMVYLYVPDEYEEKAREALEEFEIPDDADNEQE